MLRTSMLIREPASILSAQTRRQDSAKTEQRLHLRQMQSVTLRLSELHRQAQHTMKTKEWAELIMVAAQTKATTLQKARLLSSTLRWLQTNSVVHTAPASIQRAVKYKTVC